MELYLVQYDDGSEYEQQIDEIGVFESMKKATEFITSCGFKVSKNDATYFIRYQQTVIGECIAHQDYAYITKMKLNEPKEDIEYFTYHYK